MRDEYYIPKPTESAVIHDATPNDRETEAYRRGVMQLKEWHRICAKKREKEKGLR